jgi:hypothetical protein
MQKASATGLTSAPPSERRCRDAIVCLGNAPEKLADALIEEWGHIDASGAFSKLSSADVTVTNLSDKESARRALNLVRDVVSMASPSTLRIASLSRRCQLPKIMQLDDNVRRLFPQGLHHSTDLTGEASTAAASSDAPTATATEPAAPTLPAHEGRPAEVPSKALQELQRVAEEATRRAEAAEQKISQLMRQLGVAERRAAAAEERCEQLKRGLRVQRPRPRGACWRPWSALFRKKGRDEGTASPMQATIVPPEDNGMSARI